MNWLKQNKLLAGIAATGVVVAAVLLWLAFAAMGAANKAVASYKSNTNEANRLAGGALLPTPQNLEKQQKLAAELKKETDGLRDALAKRHGAAEGSEAATYGQRVQKRFQELRTQWDASGMTVPENFFLGLERYRQQIAAPAAAVKDLDYKLEAIAYVMESAIKSGVSSIDKLTRGGVIGEEGTEAKDTGAPVRRYSLEIQCTGSEAAIQAFVNAIAASPKYFLAIRAIRLQNETQMGPKREDVRREVKPSATGSAGGAADLFAGLAAAAPAAPAPAPAAALTDAEKLLQGKADDANAPAAQEFAFAKAANPDAYQFLGDEKVKAGIRLELMVFQPAAPAAPTEE